jgi:hypothetical protein
MEMAVNENSFIVECYTVCHRIGETTLVKDKKISI